MAGKSFRSCPSCRGQGKITVQVTCPQCAGEGSIFQPVVDAAREVLEAYGKYGEGVGRQALADALAKLKGIVG